MAGGHLQGGNESIEGASRESRRNDEGGSEDIPPYMAVDSIDSWLFDRKAAPTDRNKMPSPLGAHRVPQEQRDYHASQRDKSPSS